MTLGDQVAALDALGERDLLGRRQELVAPDVGQEELEAVGRSDDRVEIGLLRRLLLGLFRLLALLGGSVTDLEADGLELARELLDVRLAEIVLDDERLELDRLDVAALLALLDERASLLAFK